MKIPRTANETDLDVKKRIARRALRILADRIQEDKDFRYELMEDEGLVDGDGNLSREDAFDLVNEAMAILGNTLWEGVGRIK